jgi:hypothetical protein
LSLNEIPKEKIDMNHSLKSFPLIGSANLSEDERVLLKIPGDYKSLRAKNIEKATSSFEFSQALLRMDKSPHPNAKSKKVFK